jgi:hypothetical protein
MIVSKKEKKTEILVLFIARLTSAGCVYCVNNGKMFEILLFLGDFV